MINSLQTDIELGPVQLGSVSSAVLYTGNHSVLMVEFPTSCSTQVRPFMTRMNDLGSKSAIARITLLGFSWVPSALRCSCLGLAVEGGGRKCNLW